MASMIEIPLGNAFLYIHSKVKMRNTYESGPVPELATHITGVEQDFVQLSSLDVVIKSCTPPFHSVSLCTCSYSSVCRPGDVLVVIANHISCVALRR